MRVEADRRVCVGAGQCALVAPDVFDQGDDGVVVVRRPAPGDGAEAEVWQAEDLCPANAIRVSGGAP